LHGEQFIDVIPNRFRQSLANKNITRLLKPEDGEPEFVRIDDTRDVIKLAGRSGEFNIVSEFGVKKERARAFDITTAMAIAVGIDVLRDAGIPLVLTYKTTTTGGKLPDRWRLPDEMRDDTGIIFASAFPGADAFAGQLKEFHRESGRREQLAGLESLREWFVRQGKAHSAGIEELDRRIAELKSLIGRTEYQFDRRFLFRVLSMGHSQLAEEIGARGPNTQINGACASTTHAVSIAEDWIRQGRCRRVIVVSADNVTSDNLIEWVGAGFLASGAAATDEKVEDAATPFDRRRHGMIMGMGAAALMVESEESTRERGLQPICEILGTVALNSAFHGTRLDIDHIASVMEQLVSAVERRHGISRDQMAPQMLFMSHETYTPARGGSASAEIHALRSVFGDKADQIVITNTKGFTGHAMAAGIEDVVSVKALETGVVPPVPNFREIDPELGDLNLSTGGTYPVQYALRLGAGFGSQLGMSLTRWVPPPDGRRRNADQLGYGYRIADASAWANWLGRASGYEAADLEVVTRRLRIRDQGAPAGKAAPSAAHIPVSRAPEPAATEAGSAVRFPDPVPSVPAPAAPVPAFTPSVPEPVPEAPGPAPVTVAGDGVEEAVINLVAEKTDYPPDMLDLDLDLEADLGVDTVKQAEVFAEIRAKYDIPRDEDLQLREFPTLAHVVQFVRDRAPDLPQTADVVETASETLPEPEAVSPGVDDDDAIRAKVLEVVAGMTGYPPDMLDMELDLEADLGVDTVKQAEIFAALREAYDIPRDETLQLKDFPTLNHAIGFVKDRRPDTPASSAPPGESADILPATVVADEAITADMDAANRVPRRVPTAVWRPALDLFKSTGAELKEGSRVVIMPDSGGVAAALAGRLEKRRIEALVFDPGTGAASIEAQLEGWISKGAINGVYWLPALDAHAPLAEMSHKQWRETTRQWVKCLHTTMRALYGQVEKSGSFLVAATRMGGKHGYDEKGALNPIGGGVSGFVKAYKRERPDVLCKVIDFAQSRKTAALADRIIDETLRDPGAVEIGLQNGQRWAIGIEEVPCDGSPTGVELNQDSVFLVTGAAGSIVSAIVRDLAAASAGTFHMLDLTPEPDPHDPDIARFSTDKEGLKRDIFERIKSSGEKATPAGVEKELSRLERSHAALTAIEAVESSGGKAIWHSIDLTDDGAVCAVIEQVKESGGKLDVLIHAGGLEISRLLVDKSRAEFDRVFDVKCDGWHSLLRAIGDTPLQSAVVFSSVAGRFGNGGQTDYSAANDLLCKSISGFLSTRPQTLGVAIDWTAWGGIGMASRGSIPAMMKAAGIDMLAPEAGIPTVRRELTQGPSVGEIVVGERLGRLTEEWDTTGGLDLNAITTDSHGPMMGQVTGMGLYGGLTVETELDPGDQAFLFDHRIDGTPVLPGVMGLEAFAELSTLLLPGWRVASMEDIQFMEPFKFYRDEPRKLRLTARFGPSGEQLTARCALISERQLQGKADPVISTAFRATVRLSQSAPEVIRGEKPVSAGEVTLHANDVYQVYFHGPAYQVLGSAWGDGPGTVIGQLADSLPANHAPKDLPTKMAPRLIELCFQTAGMYELGVDDRFGLPSRISRVQKLREASPDNMPFYSIVRHSGNGAGYDADVVDQNGDVYLRLTDYRTSELPGAAAALQTGPIKAVFQASALPRYDRSSPAGA
jgi:3-oxoacyl-(acyl-carrier-protein) synthase/NAD(P)-dependent dehydrogenase (short-subunit alcohol dehydrogenase family)/acyl carrier protein